MINFNLYKPRKSYLENKSKFLKRLTLCFVSVLMPLVLIKSFFLYEIHKVKKQNIILQHKLK